MDAPQGSLAHMEETESVDLQSGGRVSTACTVLCVLCLCLAAGTCGYYIGAGRERVSQRGVAECAEGTQGVAEWLSGVREEVESPSMGKGTECASAEQTREVECLSAEKVREVAEFVGKQRRALVAAMAGEQWTESAATEMLDATLRLMARLKTIHL